MKRDKQATTPSIVVQGNLVVHIHQTMPFASGGGATSYLFDKLVVEASEEVLAVLLKGQVERVIIKGNVDD